MKKGLDFEKRNTVKAYHYAYISEVIGTILVVFSFYVDLFFIWLLYRFMKPQKTMSGHRTEASVLLFAHDAQRAEQTLVDIYRENQDERTTEIMIN